MRILLAAFALLTIQSTFAQPQEARRLSPAPAAVSVLTFSSPDLDNPLRIPYSMLTAPPTCDSNGDIFLQFWAGPPTYHGRLLYSVSPKGDVTQISTDGLVGLTDIAVRTFDPGISGPAMLLWAVPAGISNSASERPRHGFYLARFDRNGKSLGISRLDLDFQPGEIAQLDDDLYLVLGTAADLNHAKASMAIIDERGTIQRRLDTGALIPSGNALQTAVQSMNVLGMDPRKLPPGVQLSSILSQFSFAHAGAKLLMLEPGPSAKMIELSPSGEVRIVKLQLPDQWVAASILPAPGRWLVRAHLEQNDGESSLYEIDQESGAVLREIRTSGIPATTIACSEDNDFYGLRWLNRKPYLIVGTL